VGRAQDADSTPRANAGGRGIRDTQQNRFQIEIVPADGTSAAYRMKW
jgi:hypothetical protein